MVATKMHIRYWRLMVFSIVFIFFICLMFVWTLTSQEAPRQGPSLVLTGPDEEEFLTCSVPSPLPLDTTVFWYADGVVLQSEILLSGMVDSELMIDEIFDLIGHLPEEVQCSISDEKVGYISVMSNSVYLEEDEE